MSTTVHNLLSKYPASDKLHFNEKIELDLMKRDKINIEAESTGLINKPVITSIYLDMDRGFSKPK